MKNAPETEKKTFDIRNREDVIKLFDRMDMVDIETLLNITDEIYHNLTVQRDIIYTYDGIPEQEKYVEEAKILCERYQDLYRYAGTRITEIYDLSEE